MVKRSKSRKVARHSCLVPVDQPDSPVLERMKTVDISRKGLGLISSYPLSAGDDIAVRMDLSAAGRSVVVWGKVRWVRRIHNSGNYRLGIGFNKPVTMPRIPKF